ncbi:putative ubiquitin-associated domain-containing protein 1-like, partial [Triplophysa rosa]
DYIEKLQTMITTRKTISTPFCACAKTLLGPTDVRVYDTRNEQLLLKKPKAINLTKRYKFPYAYHLTCILQPQQALCGFPCKWIMSVTQAMEWLIEHIDDPMIDGPLPGQDTPGATAAAEAPGLSTTTLRAQACLPYQSSTEGARHDELTEIFQRIRRKREFRPDSRAVIALMEMGFDEKEVIDALRVNNNQQDAACEWLLGERKPTPEDLDKGIDTNSPLFQAILENPVVQLGLTNPKTLLAFEDMLENPLNSTQWMNDPETGPVMLQISRIFQTLNRT